MKLQIINLLAPGQPRSHHHPMYHCNYCDHRLYPLCVVVAILLPPPPPFFPHKSFPMYATCVAQGAHVQALFSWDSNTMMCCFGGILFIWSGEILVAGPQSLSSNPEFPTRRRDVRRGRARITPPSLPRCFYVCPV